MYGSNDDDDINCDNVDDNHIVENSRLLENECICGSEACKSINLTEELDKILPIDIVFKNQTYYDKFWPLLTNRQMDVESYLKLLNEYRIEYHCGIAWPANFIAYRCRTCSDSLSMSICADCFHNGNHEGHDYNMFKSGSGGACDCGHSIVKDFGHCKKHGKNAIAKRANEQTPKNLICIPKRIMPRLLHRLAIFLRTSIGSVYGIEMYIDFLNKLIDSSAIMRSLMIEALISEKAYTSQIKLFSNHSDRQVKKILEDGLKSLKREMKNSIPFKIPNNWNPVISKIINKNRDKSNCTNFIEEFIFWIIHYDFSQKLVCFFMSFLMDDKFKQVFTRLYIQYYPRMLMVMIAPNIESDSRRPTKETFELLTRGMRQVSVQFFMDKSLNSKLFEEEYALHTLIYCLKIGIEGLHSHNIKSCVRRNPLCGNNLRPENRKANVVLCDNIVIRERNLVSFTLDLNDLLDVESETERLILDKDLCDIWLETLLNFQTIRPYRRELIQHAPYETNLHISPFTIETDFCMNSLLTILHNLKIKTTKNTNLVKSLLQSIHANLSNWIHNMGLNSKSIINPYKLNFHIPVHRMFGATLRHLLFIQKLPEQEVYKLLYYNQYRNRSDMTIVEFLKVLLIHPLQALTLYHEVRSNMWTRNGFITINQAAIYVHGACCNCTIDIDMFLLRYSAAKLSPNYFLKTLMSKFHAWKLLSYKTNELLLNNPSSRNSFNRFLISTEQSFLMLESALLVLIQMLTLSIHCNISKVEQIRQELIAIISVSDRPYSYLYDMSSMDNIRFIFDDEDFSKLLHDLASYKPPQHGTNGLLQQGYYTLKSETWDNEYDPIFVQYRFYQKRDYQASLERFNHHAKSKGKLKNYRSRSSPLWPPLKVPSTIGNFGNLDLSQIFDSQTLIGIIFSILYKDLYVIDLPDVVISYSIYLLELSIRKYLECFDKGKFKFESFLPGDHFNNQHYIKELTPIFNLSDSHCKFKKNKNSDLGNLLQPKNYGISNEDLDDLSQFPIINNALDLNFETWFPFDKNIIFNLFIFIHNVHSMRSREFKLRLKDDKFDDDDELSENTDAETSSSEFMSWSNDEENDDDYDLNDDDIDCDVDDNDDEDDDYDDDDDDDDDDDGAGDSQNDNLDDDEFQLLNDADIDNQGRNRITGVQMLTDNDTDNGTTDSDSEITELISQQRQIGNNSQNVVSHLSDNSTTTMRINDGTNLNRQDFYSNIRNRITNIQNQQQNQRTPDSIISASTDCTTSDQSRIGSQPRDNTINNPTTNTEELLNIESVPIIDDVEMDSVNSHNNGDVIITTININTNDSHVIENDNSDNITSGQVSHIGSVASNVDHTYSNNSNNNNENSMEVDSLPEVHSTALSLIPVNQHLVRVNSNDDDQATQVYPENLVTERRAILASEPRPMITSGEDQQQPLALQSSGSTTTTTIATFNDDISTSRNLLDNNSIGDISQNYSAPNTNMIIENNSTTTSTNINNSTTENRDSRSFSDFDIQARFGGFFHQPGRHDFRPNNSRSFRARQQPQTARRGGPFRGVPVSSFTSRNTNNDNELSGNTTTAAAPAPAGPPTPPQPTSTSTTGATTTIPAALNRPRQFARRSYFANNLSGRVLTSERGFYTQSQQQLMEDIEPEVHRSFVSYKGLCRESSSKNSDNCRTKRYEKLNYGESLITLLLRLHSKYSQRIKSYKFDEKRAQMNKETNRSRIGDGVHFINIILDLICSFDQKIKFKVDLLQKLIWIDKEAMEIEEKLKLKEQQTTTSDSHDNKNVNFEIEDNQSDRKINSQLTFNSNEHKGSQTTTIDFESNLATAAAAAASSANKTEIFSLSGEEENSSTKIAANKSSEFNSLSERKRKAKETQRKLMAEFVRKQNAFIENYESNSNSISRQAAHTATKTSQSSAFGGRPSSLSTATSSTLTSDKTANAGLDGISSSAAAAAAVALKTCLASPAATAVGPSDHVDDEPINLSSKSNASQEQSSIARDCDNKKVENQQLPESSSKDDKIQNKNDRYNQDQSRAGTSTSYNTTFSFNSQTSTTEASHKIKNTSNSHYNDPKNDNGIQTYECCICNVEGLNDLEDPFCLVVLLQSTSIYGHSHLRPKNERCLPIDEFEYKILKEETYAKYLERRIDLLCEHFSQLSWLDSINIGAEGGVHVQSCGHYIHIKCYQRYIKSLNSDDRVRGGIGGGGSNNSLRSDSDEFLCPICRQLANSVLPILNDLGEPGYLSLAKVSSKDLYHQIKLIGSNLKERLLPDQKELHSSAAFCSHLTKATGPQYRLVRSNASMHSLFLFLTSIARTNLETDIIVRRSLVELSATNVNQSSSPIPSTSTSKAPPPPPPTTTTTTKSSTLRTTGKKVAGELQQSEINSQRRSCFQLLFHVLALNAQTLINDQWFTYDQIWSHLTQSYLDDNERLSVKPMNSEVPLLLRDPTAMLLQFLFTLINSLCYKENFTCIVKILFNLTMIQSIALVLSYIKPNFILEQQKSQLLLENNTHDYYYYNKNSDDDGEEEEDKMVINDEMKQECDSIDIKSDKQEFREEEANKTSSSLKKHELNESGEEDIKVKKEKGEGEKFSSTAYQFATNDFDRLVVFVGLNLYQLLANPTNEPLMNSAVRNCWSRFSNLENNNNNNDGNNKTNNDGIETTTTTTTSDDPRKQFELIENRVKLACLPFLRACALIQHHLYSQTYPSIELAMGENNNNNNNNTQIADDQDICDQRVTDKKFIEAEFETLANYLDLNKNITTVESQIKSGTFELATATTSKVTNSQTTTLLTTRPDSISHFLDWPPAVTEAFGSIEKTTVNNNNNNNNNGKEILGERLIVSWSSELLHKFGREYSIAARTLFICRPLAWFKPSLVKLPKNFDDIFMHYYKKKCSLCLQIPKDVAICLVCGSSICFRVSCCKDRSRSRQEHSQHCGANTAVFLAIHTSAIVVIRGNRACVWGSVYLDAHGEEDNGLQRGKPLYLVDARYKLLEKQWLKHSFDQTCNRKWVYLNDNLL